MLQCNRSDTVSCHSRYFMQKNVWGYFRCPNGSDKEKGTDMKEMIKKMREERGGFTLAELLVVVRYGLSVQTVAYLVLVCILMSVALVDLDTFIIPNGFVVAGCVLWLVSIWFMPAPRVDAFSVGSLFSGWVHPGGAVALDGIVGAAVVAGGVLVLSVAFDKVTKRRSLGGGDVKLLFMVGLFLGLAGSMLNLLMACLMGLAFAFAQGFSVPSSPGEGEGEGESVRTRAIPFGPAIAAATAFTLLAGPTILTWYAGLF